VDGPDLPDWAMANAITSFATMLAGIYTTVLALLVRNHPARWLHAYAWIFLTGIPTLGLHGFGEPFQAPTHGLWRVADTGSNLILAWALQLAVLGDFHAPAVRLRVALASLALNLAAIAWMIGENFGGIPRRPVVPLGEFGGFYLGELVLILDSLFVTALLYRARQHIPPRARPLLNLVAVSFVVGLLLATADNQEVVRPVIAFHALWHLVGAFGFLALFVFNHVRFEEARSRAR
jgi:hypothetical protein